MAFLNVTDLYKDFPVYSGVFRRQTSAIHAVSGVNLAVNEREIVALVGESGSGKSTAGRCAIGLLKPTSGDVYFQGTSIFSSAMEKKKMRQQLQMIFQDPYSSLNPRISVGEAVAEAVLFHRIVNEGVELHDYVAHIFELVGLDPSVRQRYPHEFSGGQQQRICIGRALALKPQLIVCDECVSALDVSVQAQVLNLLLKLREEFGLSLLFITHDLSVVRYLADRVLVMEKGQIVESGRTEKLFASPQHPYTAALLSAQPSQQPKR